MHRRPTLTQREGVFSTTRYILYGNRVRVIHQTPLVRDDRYIPLGAVDPDANIVRQPSLRLASLALLAALPGLLALAGWPESPGSGTTTAAVGLSLLGLVTFGIRGWPGRTYVRHGLLQFLADLPDPTTFRHFEGRLVEAVREHITEHDPDPDVSGTVSVASEIRRLHDHCSDGHLPPKVFVRHKQRLIHSIREYLP